MAVGPGKYDAECTIARISARADAVVLIVLGGKNGNGFSVQATQETQAKMNVPALLRRLANKIDQLDRGRAHLTNAK